MEGRAAAHGVGLDGVGGFPIVVEPDQKLTVKDWGIEAGVLFHPKGF